MNDTVVTPDIPNAPYVTRGGVKYFDLTAEPVEREILPGVILRTWCYNGLLPGPTIVVEPGDYVCIRVANRLPEPTSVHWHGLFIPNAMDGVPDAEPSPRIDPGKSFEYRFKIVNPPGTYMYHSHWSARQEMRGMGGGFIVLDTNPYRDRVQRDYFMMLQEFRLPGMPPESVAPGIYPADPESESFNFFTINGRCFPHTSPLQVRQGDAVRLRFANFMMNAHPMHLHGHPFAVSGADGHPIAHANRVWKNTIPVASGETWDVEFHANNPGSWALHCHMPHHTSNNKAPGLGGMFTKIVYV
ncbi:multicopper oxidase family protein [Paenibacillus thermoaerophilus]|uniref:Multicopper oxidase family protein n=1 Tax=Paenibacillus thermoaerophilus TaxID=1215385 RepID=A0ABW2V1D0_9BACL|nr:multicopper oxidase domain-containing protein [Paenibacillus thermoaerophilus]TMV18484.1 copper oxidase [Paenibacillus thermoaerophilus]